MKKIFTLIAITIIALPSFAQNKPLPTTTVRDINVKK